MTRGVDRGDDLPASSGMSDEREIRPAMSPEEWAKWRNGILPELTTHGKAAACLHGQPFGFTMEDVEGLRELAAWIDKNVAISGPPMSYPGPLHDLADRIEALLPPREP